MGCPFTPVNRKRPYLPELVPLFQALHNPSEKTCFSMNYGEYETGCTRQFQKNALGDTERVNLLLVDRG